MVGVYWIVPTSQSIAQAARYHEYNWLLDKQGEYKELITEVSISNLALVELEIECGCWNLELDSIQQDDQAPYLEFYLDPSGTQRISEDEWILKDAGRICFFVHFLDIGKPLSVATTSLSLPEPDYLPDRLRPFSHYIPVD